MRPVFTWTTFIGMRPRKVASANFDRGTSRMGEEILINQFGRRGVILKNRR